MGSLAISIGKSVGVQLWSNLKPNGFPSALVATVISASQINLAWTIGSTNQDGHRIYISTDNITFTEKGTVLGTSATYSATSLTEATGYYFKVVAYKGTKESDVSNTSRGVTEAVAIRDGNTSGWFKSDDLSKITKDVDNNISAWINSLAASPSIVPPSSPYPIFNSNIIQFKGNSYLTKNFTYNLPVTIMLTVKAKSFTDGDVLFAGWSNNNAIKSTQTVSSPNINFGNATSIGTTPMSLNNWHVVVGTILSDGTATFQVDDQSKLSGNAGILLSGGFSIGARSDGFGKSDIEVLEIILRKDVDNDKNAKLKQYLQNRLAFFLT